MTSFQEMTFSELLSDAEVFVDGDWVESKDQDQNGDVRLIQLADIGDGFYIDKSSRFLNSETAKRLKCTYLKEGDILVARMPDPLGRTCIFPKSEMPCVTVVDVCIIRPNQNKVDNRWLMHTINSPVMRQRINEYVTGTTRQRISRGNFSKLKVSVPPLAEQRRIAAILDQADELRQKRQQAIEKLDQLLQATFIDMFGDPVDNLKGLETVALLDLCKKITDGTHQSPKWTTDGIPFLFISNIVDGEIDYSSQKFIDQVTYDSLTKSTKIELNDILYTTVGSYGNVARVKSDQLFCFQRHIAHIKPSFDKVNPKFLEKMLSSYGVRRQADRLVRGVAQKTLNLKDLKEIIVFNISLDEQNHFVQKCEVIESLKIKSKLALNQIDDLFKSLQNQAFSGNL